MNTTQIHKKLVFVRNIQRTVSRTKFLLQLPGELYLVLEKVFAVNMQRLYDKLQTFSDHFFFRPTLFAGYSLQEVNI